MEVKRRKITRQDWREVEKHLSSELAHRKDSEFRKAHEAIWKEVDRQVSMKPMRRVINGKDVNDWHSTVEIGELSKASEVITADVRRMLFPAARAWFDAHSEIPIGPDEQGTKRVVPSDAQNFIDGSLRALMIQQHMDFGFKARVELSIKEALHHGSFVAEAKIVNRQKISDGSKVENIGAPVWIPHSMWNCYPDPSQSVIGTDMFYDGSMMILSHMPIHLIRDMAKGDGWMNIDKIPGDQKKDINLVTYYGDLVIKRTDAEIFLPNCKAITANDTIIYYAPNDLPHAPIIFGGYERLDVRDPYYTSPIVKLSPMQKLGSVMVNKFIEAVALKTEPPIVYDGSDSYFVQTGGPVIAPGVKTPTKGTANWKEVDVGDPTWAANGLNMAINAIQSGTGVNAIRAGGESSDRRRTSATEVIKTSQAGEVRTVDFVDKLESQGLRPFLYMQHALNVKFLKGYSFYNSEMDAPDFMRVDKTDLPQVVHFEVVGSKGLLGEEQRTQRTSAVTAFASSSPLFAPMLRPEILLKEMYQDAGNKNPERFIVVNNQEDPQIAQMKQQMEQIVQQMQQKIQELESKQQVEMAKLQQSGQIEQAKAEQSGQIDQAKMQMDAQIEQAKLQLEQEKAKAEIELKAKIAEAEMQLKREIAQAELAIKAQSGDGDMKLRERVEMMKFGREADGEAQVPGALDVIMRAIQTSTSETAQAMLGALGSIIQANTSEAAQVMLDGVSDMMNQPLRIETGADGNATAVIKGGKRLPVIRNESGRIQGLGTGE